jgi:hypothetical protein
MMCDSLKRLLPDCGIIASSCEGHNQAPTKIDQSQLMRHNLIGSSLLRASLVSLSHAQAAYSLFKLYPCVFHVQGQIRSFCEVTAKPHVDEQK